MENVFKNPWFIGITTGAIFFALGFFFRDYSIKTTGNNSPVTAKGDIHQGDNINGDKLTADKIYIDKQDEIEEKEEKLEILLSINEIRNTKSVKYSQEWDEIVVDVVNTGNLSLYLDKAEFLHNDVFIGYASLKQVKTNKIDKNISAYTEYYPKLDSGEKYDDLHPYFYKPDDEVRKSINPGDFVGKITIKIKTTRGNWFSKSIIKKTNP